MPDDLDQLVTEVAELTGAPRPAWLEEDAPLLNDERSGGVDGDFYLIGLIGGKDVGKSALVNAIVGHEITAQTSHGPGTETVIAYAHQSRAPALREMLDREAPGRYRIITHDLSHLSRQVLLDLPDIDSHYADHVALTRRMLRHMLFPVWMQSVEKYADRQPQELLLKVAAGNAPANFVFCLNKVDQVERLANGGSAAIGELREDYAQRLAGALALESPPRVWAIAAIQPGAYELPALRDVLAQQKSEANVRESRENASLRRRASILAWLEAQDLSGRAGRLRRLLEEAQETLDDRVGVPLLENFLPALTDDPAYRQAIIDDCLARRTSRWPIVGALHGLYFAIGALVRRNVEAKTRKFFIQNGESLVETHLRELVTGESNPVTLESPKTVPGTVSRIIGESGKTVPGTVSGDGVSRTTGRSMESLLQTTFALLQQTHPTISWLYQDRKLWESMPASLATGELRQTLAKTIDRQRNLACARLDVPSGPLMFLWRSLLTIGAIVWFIFLQPVLLAMVRPADPMFANEGIISRLIQSLGPGALLNAFVCLMIYFTALWLLLRWDTQRRVQRQFAAWRRLDDSKGADASLNLVARTMQWIGALLDPIRRELARVDATAARVEALRKSMEQKRN